MTKYILKRLVVGAIVVLLVSTAVFFITRIIANPETAFLPIDASDAQRASVRSYLGLDQSLVSQFGHFIGRLLRGDLGDSYWQPGKSAISIVLDRLPATLALNVVAMVVALAFALPMGILAAIKPGSALDRVVTTITLLGLSAPQFWIGYMLILIFGVHLQWFPTSGANELLSITLPALALALPTAGKIAQMMRSTAIDEFDRAYMTTAQSKGLSRTYRITHHAFRNSLVPVLTQSSFEFARMLAGFTVVVETVFAWPGIGQLTVQALEQQDLMLLQAIVIVVAVMIVIVNLVTDMLYTVIDPRIEFG